LQSQQILHLDCINVVQVVQWLVSKVIEVCKQTSDLVRIYSESQFKNYDYQLPAEAMYEEQKPTGLEYLSACNKTYAQGGHNA